MLTLEWNTWKVLHSGRLRPYQRISLGWKSLPATNTQAYYKQNVNYRQTSFISLAPGQGSRRLSEHVIYFKSYQLKPITDNVILRIAHAYKTLLNEIDPLRLGFGVILKQLLIGWTIFKKKKKNTKSNYKFWNLMERHIFATVIDCSGRHWKGIAIYNATEVNLL